LRLEGRTAVIQQHIFYGERTVHLALKPGIVRQEFIDLVLKTATGQARAADARRLTALKSDLARRLLSLEPAQAFAVW
jgi:hypothetical protein